MMKRALIPIRRRIRLLRAAKGFFLGLIAGAAASCAFLVVSFFVPIEATTKYLLMLFIGISLIGVLFAALMPVTIRRAAFVADGCGLKERVLTALSFANEDTPIHRLQRADAEEKLRALPIRESLPIKPNQKLLYATAAMAVACAVLLLVPNPQHEALRARQNMRAQLLSQADLIEKAAESVDASRLTPDEQKELRRITSEMARELREAKDTREALESMNSMQSDMEKLRQQIKERQSSNATAPLASQPALKSLADAIQGGNSAQMEEALAQLAETLSNAETKEEITNQLELASELAEATELQQMLENAAAMIGANNIQGGMQALSNYFQSAQSVDGNLASLMQTARAGIAQAGSAGTGAMGNAPGSGSKAGLGSTQFDQGYQEGFSQSAGAFGTGPIVEKVGQYEQIYDPTRLGGDSEASLVPGEMGEGESQQMQIGPGMGGFAGSVPYNQVIGEYQEAAAQAMSRAVLPEAAQDWVTRYFDALIQ